jgi:hypothetical protein
LAWDAHSSGESDRKETERIQAMSVLESVRKGLKFFLMSMGISTPPKKSPPPSKPAPKQQPEK